MHALPISSVLDGELNVLLQEYSAGRPAEMALQRLATATQENLKHDALPGYQILAYLQALRLRANQVHENFQKALRLSNRKDYVLMINYAHALFYVGEVKASSEILSEIYADVLDIDQIVGTVNIAMQCCMFEEGIALYDRLRKMNREDLVDPEHYHEAERGRDIIKKANVTQEDISDRLEVAAKTYVNHVLYPAFRVQINVFDGIHYSFASHKPVSDLVEADWAIVDALIEQFDDPLESVITISTNCMQAASDK